MLFFHELPSTFSFSISLSIILSQIPCETGMFGNLTKASESRDCYPCPKNTFSSQPGSKACRPCGSSAYADGRAAKCDCIGQNRMFSLSDGSCYCKSGFVYYDDVDVKKEEGNSDKDCQRIVSFLILFLYLRRLLLSKNAVVLCEA